MAENNTSMLERLATIEDRLRRLEETMGRSELREAAVPPWRYLVRRRHLWRQQLYLKGRNLTARQLVGAMKANQLGEDAATADYHLPLEAVREAVAYVAQNRQLLETEAEIERLMLQRGGIVRGPQVVS